MQHASRVFPRIQSPIFVIKIDIQTCNKLQNISILMELKKIIFKMFSMTSKAI